jgi:hypothetical protein
MTTSTEKYYDYALPRIGIAQKKSKIGHLSKVLSYNGVSANVFSDPKMAL